MGYSLAGRTYAYREILVMRSTNVLGNSGLSRRYLGCNESSFQISWFCSCLVPEKQVSTDRPKQVDGFQNETCQRCPCDLSCWQILIDRPAASLSPMSCARHGRKSLTSPTSFPCLNKFAPIEDQALYTNKTYMTNSGPVCPITSKKRQFHAVGKKGLPPECRFNKMPHLSNTSHSE